MKQLIAVALIVTITGCATESQQAQTESTALGATLGAIGGAIAGKVIGNKKGAAIGAATGAVIGGAAGYVYGNRMAQHYQELQGKENDLDAQINFARKVNQDTETYNQKLRQDIASTQQEVNALTAQAKRQQITQQQLQEKRQQLKARVNDTQQQLSATQKETQKAYNELIAFRSRQPQKSAELDAQISKLKVNLAQLKSNERPLETLATQSQRL